MKNLLFLFLLLCSTCSLFGQDNLNTIFKSSRNFTAIVEQGETYFQDKYPGIPFHELTIGEHRDGEFVKFMRWRKFWSGRLNPDGSLGDPSAYWRQQAREDAGDSRTPTNPYEDVPWNNISYEDYIVSQIGLGRATSMAFHPTDVNTFYVGAAIGGIWKTTDAGQTYTPLGDALPFMPVSSIVVDQSDPNTIYIAVSDHVWYGPGSIGVYKSTNGGGSWSSTALTFDLADDYRIYWMEADPNNPNVLLVATENGIYRTADGFATVEGVSSTNAFDVKFMPGNSAIVYAGGTGGQFLKSTNGGQSFTQITDFGSGRVLLGVTAMNDQKVFARNGSSLRKSFDAGESFPETSSFASGGEVFAFAPADDNIILSGNFECYRSDDEGNSFTAITQWLGQNGLPLIHVDQRNMFVNPLETDAVYFCNDGGVYRYTISSGTFTNLCNGLLITQFYDIAVAQGDPNIIGGGSQDNGNVFRSSEGIWSQYANTGDGMNQDIDPNDNDTRYWAYQNGAMRRWRNGNNSNISPPGKDGNGAWETPFKLDPSNSDRLVCAYDQAYESMNNGDTWNTIGGAFGGNANEIAIAPSNGERIYVTRGSSLYIKNVADDTWTTRSLPNGDVSDLEVDFTDINLIYVSVPGYGDGQKIYQSPDAGLNWVNITGTLPNVSVGALELYAETPGGIFIGTDAGVYYRDDNLSDWLEYGQLPHTRIEDIEIQYAAELTRVGTHGRGVLEAPIEVDVCTPDSPDADGDGFCDLIDLCPDFDNNLIGQPCDDGDEFSQGETFSTSCGCSGGAAFVEYCQAEGAPGTGSDYITRVSLGDINNSSGQTGYSDFRHISTRLDHGQEYPISVRIQAFFAPDRVHAWIDYDRNGTFDADEAIDMTVPVTRTSTGTVSVPLDAVRGATTMRVRVIYSTSVEDPCGSYFGEVEDYTVFLDCAEGSSHPQCNLLPIDWIGFDAKPDGPGQALLTWETEQETELAHFAIERSADGSSFTEISQLTPTNTSSLSTYAYIDENIWWQNAYYRIKAVSFDGTESFTEIKEVSWPEYEADPIVLYPNPTTSTLYIRLAESVVNGSVDWEIQNVQGQTVIAGQQLEFGTERIGEIAVDNLPAGAYTLSLRAEDFAERLPFVKN